MGGMLVLEWAYFGPHYVRCIVPIATSSRHSAWGISWGEAQRQSIYADPKYDDGYYAFADPPTAGLGAARMSALLTYRSRNSFESRFGRNTPDPSRQQTINDSQTAPPTSEGHWAIHNDGHKTTRPPSSRSRSHSALTTPRSTPADSPVATPGPNQPQQPQPQQPQQQQLHTDPQFHGATTPTPTTPPTPPPARQSTSYYYSAQSYLRYQGAKFVARFDPNCYIAITRKLDTHDISRSRTPSISAALSQISQPTLVLGIESDGLFTFAEQEELAEGIPNARLRRIESMEGHDAFLLQFEQVNGHILKFLREVLPDIMGRDGAKVEAEVGGVTRSSTFGEAEVEDITAW
jgi:homoserine O-acetyltransferase